MRFTIAITSVVVLLVLLAVVTAFRTLGTPFPGLFVDPYGSYSAVHLPTWGAPPPLRFPDTLVDVNGNRTSDYKPESRRAHALQNQIQTAVARGGQTVRLRFESTNTKEQVVLERPLRQISGIEVVFFGLVYNLVALFLLWSALVVCVLSPQRGSVFAYVFWAVGCALFFLSFFDYHTSRHFAPLFSIATGAVQVGFLLLAYTFPTPPIRLRRLWLSALLSWIGVVCLVLALLFIFDRLGHPTRGLRVFLTLTGSASTAVLLLSVLGRFLVSGSETRTMLRMASAGLVIVPASLAVLYFAAALGGRAWVHLFLPFLAAMIPLSIGYSLIRTNILHTSAILSRKLLLLTCVLAAGIAAFLSWALASEMAGRNHLLGLTVTVAVAFGAGTFFASRRLLHPLMFDAGRHFRPTIETLTDELGAVRDQASAERAILRVVTHWLPISNLRLVQATEVGSACGVSDSDLHRLKAGMRVWVEKVPGQRVLLQPMRAFGQLNAVVLLGPKSNNAPYSEDELTLLETIASLGALALHSAAVLSHVEASRRVEVGAAHDEKRLTLGLLAAELGHELAYPLNFFRYLLDRAASPRGLEAEDLDIGREEVERLARMLQTLRRMRIPPPSITKVQLQEPIKRALELNRELIATKGLQVTLNIDTTAAVAAGFDQMVQIFANLIRNAAEAAPVNGTVGVRSIMSGRFIDSLEVWDNGQGIDPALAGSLFSPWATTKPGGRGLGLAVAQRLAHGFEWKLAYHREEPLTYFCLMIKRRSEDHLGSNVEDLGIHEPDQYSNR